MVSAKVVGSIDKSARAVLFSTAPLINCVKIIEVKGGGVSTSVKYPRYHLLEMYFLSAKGHVNVTAVFSLATNALATKEYVVV